MPCQIRVNSTWTTTSSTAAEEWEKASVIKAHFRSQFQTLIEDDEEDGDEQEQDEDQEDYRRDRE